MKSHVIYFFEGSFSSGQWVIRWTIEGQDGKEEEEEGEV